MKAIHTGTDIIPAIIGHRVESKNKEKGIYYLRRENFTQVNNEYRNYKKMKAKGLSLFKFENDFSCWALNKRNALRKYVLSKGVYYSIGNHLYFKICSRYFINNYFDIKGGYTI